MRISLRDYGGPGITGCAVWLGDSGIMSELVNSLLWSSRLCIPSKRREAVTHPLGTTTLKIRFLDTKVGLQLIQF